MELDLAPWVVATIASVFGLLVGSFVNVVVWRVPRGESIVRPGSHCQGCDTPLRALDNVPVVSWVVLRGRCRYCSGHISARYPATEFGSALLFWVVGYRFSDSWSVFAYLVLVAALLALSLIDIDHLLLPNKVIYPSAALVVPLLVLASALEHEWNSLGRAALGAAIDFAIFFTIWFVAPSAMGYGDVRLSALLGFALGWLGWPALFLGMFLPFLLGTVGGIAVAAPVVLVPMAVGAGLGWLGGRSLLEPLSGGMSEDPGRQRLTGAVFAGVTLGALVYMALSLRGKVERGRQIPFGPYLAAGAVLALLALA